MEIIKVLNIDLTRLHNDEHFHFFIDFQTCVKADGAATLKIEEQYATLQALFAREDEALKKITRSVLTEKIAAADHARDVLFRSLSDTVKAARTHYNLAVSEAAKIAWNVMLAYGNVVIKPYVEESSAIYNLCKDLKEKHAEAILTLGLVNGLTELEKLNKAVDDLMNERYDEATERTELVLKQVRAEVDEAYRMIVVKIEALQVLEGHTEGAPWADFIRRLNIVIERANNTVAQRKGRAAAKTSSESGLQD